MGHKYSYSAGKMAIEVQIQVVVHRQKIAKMMKKMFILPATVAAQILLIALRPLAVRRRSDCGFCYKILFV
jgi:hypothetical protein